VPGRVSVPAILVLVLVLVVGIFVDCCVAVNGQGSTRLLSITLHFVVLYDQHSRPPLAALQCGTA